MDSLFDVSRLVSSLVLSETRGMEHEKLAFPLHRASDIVEWHALIDKLRKRQERWRHGKMIHDSLPSIDYPAKNKATVDTGFGA